MKPILQFLQPKLLLLLGLALLGLVTLPWSQELGLSPTSDPGSFESRKLEIQTVNFGFKSECDIEVTRKNAAGEILWQKTYGGSSYDKGAAVLKTQDGGALILGSTSAFGAGNYDILLIKTDPMGEVLWQRTYGGGQ
ncbi:hypothetical protein [Algoriphagus sp.]|uniref:hypothetical protein n=1 Tax=Algoriphagus sp. TaxID=1872435 RepID=UPI0026028361|nr:hypothetical protein [Algoriphagus sp.]